MSHFREHAWLLVPEKLCLHGLCKSSSSWQPHHAVPVVQAPPEVGAGHPRQQAEADVGRQGDDQYDGSPQEYQEPCAPPQ